MLLAVAILIAIACCVREHWNRLGDEDPQWEALLRKWFIQGVAVPAGVWAIVNLGISNYFPALVPKIAIAQASNMTWWHHWVGAVVNGSAFTVICWAAITYVWMAFTVARKVGNTPEFRWAVLSVGLPMFLLAFIIGFGGNWSSLPTALLVLLMPVVHRALYIVEAPPPVPMYGAAQGKINFGKYEDAEVEVIHQLEKKDNDFNGWMLLAELYATKYRRLDDAAQVIVDLCRDPAITEVEASVACNKLADWQLEIGGNPSAARAALDLLIQRAPHSHVARMAEMRLKQMPRTREDLLDRRKPKSIRLPALRENAEIFSGEYATINKHEASQEANRLSDRLRDNPNDFGARERLAILLAEHLGQVNVGIEQLRLMINMPEMMGERAAKFLAQIATWERHLNKNEQKFQTLLNEIIRVYPNTTQAYSARRQLQLIADADLQKTVETSKPPPAPIRLQAPET
jgi:hypothetical protein